MFEEKGHQTGTWNTETACLQPVLSWWVVLTLDKDLNEAVEVHGVLPTSCCPQIRGGDVEGGA